MQGYGFQADFNGSLRNEPKTLLAFLLSVTTSMAEVKCYPVSSVKRTENRNQGRVTFFQSWKLSPTGDMTDKPHTAGNT